MTDGDALFAAVLAHPDDDTPRLAYADWLDDQGGEENAARAEFIRAQVEVARRDDGGPVFWATDPLRPVRERANALEKQYGKVWGANLRGRKGPIGGRGCWFHFLRGFPGRASAPADRLIEYGDELVRRAPVTDVTANGVTPDNLGRLLACRWLTGLRKLSLHAPYDAGAPQPDWGELAGGPRLPDLTYLWLNHGMLIPAGAERLAAADPFPVLNHFSASDLPLGDDGAAGLFGGPAFGRLDHLYLHSTGIGAAGVRALARSDGLARLSVLWMPGHPLTAGAVGDLTGGRFWPGLRQVVLYGCDLGPGPLAALAAAPAGKPIDLNVSMNRIGPAGAAALASGRLLGGVTGLDIGSNPLYDDGVRALLPAFRPGRLRDLDLGAVGLGPAGAAALADSPGLAGLRRLTLYGNYQQADGAVALADSPHLGGLGHLSLSKVRGKARKRLVERFGDRVRFY